VMAAEDSHRTSNSQVPQLDLIISTRRNESVECIVVSIGAFVELHRVTVLLMGVVYNLERLVHVSVINDQLLVRACNQADLTCHLGVVQVEGGDVLRIRVREGLQ